MARRTRRRHQHDVESEGQRGEIGARQQKGGSGAGNAAALARQDGRGGARKIAARLDFDDRQHPAAPGENVDFARRAAPMARDDTPAAQPQMPAAQQLGKAAAALGPPALGARRSRSAAGGGIHSPRPLPPPSGAPAYTPPPASPPAPPPRAA